MIVFECPGCGKKLSSSTESLGRECRCPKCEKRFAIPSEDDTHHTNGRTAPLLSGCSFLASPQRPDELGRLGSFRILKKLGAGGMGMVFLAEDANLQRQVALKVMLPEAAAKDNGHERFLREARAAASLDHDHIVPIFHVGEDRGVPFLVMPLLKGESLGARLRRKKRLPVGEAARIGREIAEGLQAAHERGLVHRDIKPENIWLSGKEGRVRILDFGLAKSTSGDTNLTQSGAILGTPSYMSPEQAQNEPVDDRCDLFSLGCLLYRMTTGSLPFEAETLASLLFALVYTNPVPPRERLGALPPALSDLILELMAKKPADRPADARAVAERLRRIEEAGRPEPVPLATPTEPQAPRGTDFDFTGLEPSPSLTAVPEVGNRPNRRARRPRPDRKWMWLAGGTLSVVLLMILLLASGGESPPAPPPRAEASPPSREGAPRRRFRRRTRPPSASSGVRTITPRQSYPAAANRLRLPPRERSPFPRRRRRRQTRPPSPSGMTTAIRPSSPAESSWRWSACPRAPSG